MLRYTVRFEKIVIFQRRQICANKIDVRMCLSRTRNQLTFDDGRRRLHCSKE